ncbi:MAG: GldG family protein [gamma proteobacterium symbiont of Taylorina sp.]|nr:GldG family protein [gamma proteobacterium symbiont of Taylorina sp.]
MKINTHSTQQLKRQNLLFILLFITLLGLLAFLSNRYIYISDWTVNGQNSLNEVSLKLLEVLESPLEIVSYTSNKAVKQSIQELISRYQRMNKKISLSFVDPNLDPEKNRALQLSVDGEMIITYQGRQEHVTELSESMISNSLHRLLRAKQRKVIFIEGHGERSSRQKANFDLSSFTHHLQKQGMHIETVNIAQTLLIPDNTSMLVIAGPQADFLPAEVSIVLDYVKKGGNLLWLGDPLKSNRQYPLYGLLPLSEYLGIEFLAGTIVDPSTLDYDIKRPDYAIVTDYPPHPVSNGFSTLTLFPQTAGIERLPGYLEAEEEEDKNVDADEKVFTATALLNTVERSWIEVSAIKNSVKFDENVDIAGPITIAMVLTRDLTQQFNSELLKQQRIIVLGDGDFLSNTFLGNGGNLTLGVNIFNWLSHDDQFLAIPVQPKNDIILDISPAHLSLLGSFFLFGIPLLLISSGSIIWLRRRHR